MKIKTTLFFLTLVILLVGVVNASDISTDTENKDILYTVEEITPNTSSVTEKNNEKQIMEHNPIKSNKTNDIKTINKPSQTYNVNTYDELQQTLTNDTYETVTININSDITLQGTTELNSEIKNLTINGNGKTIDGNQKYQFLIINSGTITINNIKLINCYGQNGGAIYNTATLTISNSTLNNNTAKVDSGDDYEGGGAITNYEGNLIIENCSFNNNTARRGGAINSYNGNLTITLSYFKNNTIKYYTRDGYEQILPETIWVDEGNLIAENNSFVIDPKYIPEVIMVRRANIQEENNIIGLDIISINSMNMINSKYVLTTKVIRRYNIPKGGNHQYPKLNGGRVSYTLDGKWIGSIDVRNERSWIVFDVPSVGNHTIVATYIDRNGKAKNTDTFTFEKIADINLLFNQYSVKNGTATVVNYVKDDHGNNINNGRISYGLNGKWIGSTSVKNGSSMIKFNYTYQKALLKATYITNSNVTQNIYTKTLDLPEFRDTSPYQVKINSMNVINGKYVLTTKISNMDPLLFSYGRVSYTLDGKWIGSIKVRHSKSWIVFDVPSIGNHTIIATYTDSFGNTRSTDTFTFEKIADVNLLFNQINVKNGTATVVNYVKDDHGNNINNGRISYSLNGKWIGSTSVKNGSSMINFNYTNTTNTLKSTYITDNNTQENIYTKTIDMVLIESQKNTAIMKV
jgi:hypothetical protein